LFACFSDVTGGRDSIAGGLPLEVEEIELFESVLVFARAGAKDGEGRDMAVGEATGTARKGSRSDAQSLLAFVAALAFLLAGLGDGESSGTGIEVVTGISMTGFLSLGRDPTYVCAVPCRFL